MSHKGIRLLIQDTAQSLGDDIQFDYARTSDFNVTASSQRYPFITLDLLSAIPEYTVDGVSNYMKRWLCQMAFYDKNSRSVTQDEYEKILDDVDGLVDNFLNKLNFYSLQADTILISNVRQTAFIDATSAHLTGYLLDFQIQQSDQFNYCSLDC